MRSSVLLAALFAARASAGVGGHRAHDQDRMGAVNHNLGAHGYPDCVQPGKVSDDVEVNQFTMKCAQRGAASTIKIACVGDSITAGAHSSGNNFTYPSQLQAMLDPAVYSVTNLGACGSTMQKGADSPYWNRPQYQVSTPSPSPV